MLTDLVCNAVQAQPHMRGQKVQSGHKFVPCAPHDLHSSCSMRRDKQEALFRHTLYSKSHCAYDNNQYVHHMCDIMDRADRENDSRTFFATRRRFSHKINPLPAVLVYEILNIVVPIILLIL